MRSAEAVDTIVTPREALDGRAGGKARTLAAAESAGLPVPRWFAVAGETIAASAIGELAVVGSARQRTVSCDFTQLSRVTPVGPKAQSPEPEARLEPRDGELHTAIVQAMRSLCPDGELVAVRSSSHDEDAVDHSFAGQLESVLNVGAFDVTDKVLAVCESALNERAVAYGRLRGVKTRSRPPAVIVQRMVHARVAGVAFSADPVSGRRGVAVVSAIPGFGSALVSGDADADTWHVDRSGAIVRRAIARKLRMHVADVCSATGVRSVDVAGSEVTAPSLNDAEVQAVADLARRAARLFGRPQDIEWAYEDDRLFLLQSRPITTLAGTSDPDGAPAIWDNSNIVESYSGVTTPLTFSFASENYEHVYRQFCRLMGVPASVIARHDTSFRNMLGLVRGRIYYNLLNWYRVLALLPGFALNRRFMEQMMGVSEALPAALADEIARGGTRNRMSDAAHLARTALGLVVSHFTLERRIRGFYQRLNEALAPPDPSLEDLRIDELVAHYRDLRSRLLLSWDAPLINDFFAMTFYGLLRRAVTAWCGDADGTLQNDLIAGEGGMVSAEPALRLQHLARMAAGRPGLVARLVTGTVDEVRKEVRRAPDFHDAVQSYLDKFGDRSINELKLETQTLHDDPLPLYRSIGALATRSSADTAAPNDASATPGAALRDAARQRVAAALAGRPFRRMLFGRLLRHARARVRDRENLRLERTRLFARVRRIFIEIGRRLHAEKLLDDPRDVFYLEVDEVLAFADGRATTINLRGLAALRREEFRAFESSEDPASRFETRGVVYDGNDFRARTGASVSDGDHRRGIGCSPGRVRGPVRVVSNPRGIDLQHRAILVAQHTDPGWVVAFPSALGIVVERGSLLSHAAIVARELGIPAVVSVPGVTTWLVDGEWVELDGAAGTIQRIVNPAHEGGNAH